MTRKRVCWAGVLAEEYYVQQVLGTKEVVIWAFMNLEEAFDRVDVEVLWRLMQICEIGGRILKAVKSMIVGHVYEWKDRKVTV